jgi:uncharacterized membrane protein
VEKSESQASDNTIIPVKSRIALTNAISALPERLVTITHQFEATSGPLPSPADLKRYDEVIPGAAAVLLEMAKEEAAHRRNQEHDGLGVAIRDQKAYRRSELFGQICALVLSLSLISGAVYLGVNGHPVVASILGPTGILGPIAAFIGGRAYLEKAKQLELDKQREQQKAIEGHKPPAQ